jgi:hypothetical protein
MYKSSLSVHNPMCVQFGIRDPNVLLLALPQVLRHSATRRSAFLANANKITHNAHSFKPSYIQNVKRITVKVREHTVNNSVKCCNKRCKYLLYI